ncbi:MAG: LysR family transcriptional regulator [Gammaproteobacteria bacterium]|nr:LysR family transcriptional regulator [Gammaproteobacteria bacterium]
MKYSLRQLEVFRAVAHSENITQAAERLNMSQSAASGALRELETRFDLQLFDRIGKRLKLNELGQVLKPQVHALLEHASDVERLFSQHNQAGTLKVGATLTIGNYLAINIMPRYMQANPGAKVALDVANTENIAAKVSNFELDIGLIEGEIQNSLLDIIPWQNDELIPFCSPENPLAKKQTLTEKDILESPWIVREKGSGTRQTFDWAMHGLLPNINIMMELQHTEGIKRAVEANLGLGCLSQIALVDAFKRGSLVPLKIPDRDFSRGFYLIVHQQKYRSPGIERWMAMCLQH